MMAEELDDGEFWLPSEILTDDDFLDLPSSGSVAGSAESETDDDGGSGDLFMLAGLTHPFTRSSAAPSSKGVNLSSSPQSTLCGFAATQGSSRGSPVEVVSPPAAAGKDDGGATWDLLYKAAGEVARMKLRSESAGKVGTGFFDCSAAKRQAGPPPPAAANIFPHPPPHAAALHFQPHFPPLSHQLRQHHHHHQQQMRSNGTNSNRPLGLPPSAWPPLQAQTQAHKQPINPSGTSIFMGQPGPKRESVGTGVFLPRRPAETRAKKSDTNGAKNRSGKAGHNKSSQQQQQKPSKSPAVNPKAIQLPQEWTY